MRYILVLIITIANLIFLFSQPPLTNAFLEDDYSEKKPLYTALEHKFTCIEIDVHLINGELLISNKHPSPRHKNTLEQLYLLPLQRLIQQNNGRIYPNYRGPFYLVIDIKTEAGLTFAALNEQLSKYEDILRTVEKEEIIPGPITVLVSGNRPIPHIWNQNKRLMAVLGQPADLEYNYPAHFMPIISANFKEYSDWKGNGKIQLFETNWLKEFCERVHKEGKKAHFWDYPEKRIVWDKLIECGVDFINTQKPKKLAKFLDDPETKVKVIPIEIITKDSTDFKNEQEARDTSTQLVVKNDEIIKEEGFSFPMPSTILANGHAHNDYVHERPLFDALDQGFTSIEVDVHLINGELYVAHDRPESLESFKTLESLYLNPLAKIVEKNGQEVYKGYQGDFYLMIDIKTEAKATYEKLKEILDEYKSMLSRLENNEIKKGPVMVILSGNRPIKLVEEESNRLVFIDGRPGDLALGYPPSLMPLISDRFSKHFKWNGIENMPEEEFEYLQRLVEITHGEDKRIRFWGSPENELVWQTLMKARVDLINTDKLSELSQFLNIEIQPKLNYGNN